MTFINKQQNSHSQGKTAQIQLTLTELNSFLTACYAKGLEVADFENLFLDFSDAVTDQTHDDALSRDLKIKLFFLRKLNFLFKSMLHPPLD